MKSVFITGTDTGIGKTIVTGLLARYLKEHNINVITQKWIQTGSNSLAEDIISQQELMGRKPSNIKKYLAYVCPYTFKFASSPHLAAKLEKSLINTGKIKNAFKVLKKNFDVVIAEGLGGVLVPINKDKLVIDIARDLKLPTIVVAGNKLGAINHTLLTIEALKGRNIKIVGIIFNNISKRGNKIILKDNPRIVKKVSKENILGTLPYAKNKDLLYKNFIPLGKKIFKFLK